MNATTNAYNTSTVHAKLSYAWHLEEYFQRTASPPGSKWDSNILIAPAAKLPLSSIWNSIRSSTPVAVAGKGVSSNTDDTNMDAIIDT